MKVSDRFTGAALALAFLLLTGIVVVVGHLGLGWARVSVVVPPGAHMQATLTGYAYETIANKAISTGKKHREGDSVQPATLGQLARGAISSVGR